MRCIPLALSVVFLFSCARGGGKAGFQYQSDIGIAIEKSGKVCLAIHNARLANGTRVQIVNVAAPQSVAKAEVLGQAEESCASTFKGDGELSRYEIRLLEGSLTPLMPSIAVAGSARPLELREGKVTADVEGDGHQEFFRSCTSGEGVHLTVWSGNPLEGKRRWHQYHYLGYDVEPDCKPKDIGDKDIADKDIVDK